MLKILSEIRQLLFPVQGIKKSNCRITIFTRQSDSNFEGAQFIKHTPLVNWPSGHAFTSRRAGKCISSKIQCKSFLKVFWAFERKSKSRKISFVYAVNPIRVAINHPRPDPNNVLIHAKKSSALPCKKFSRPFLKRPKCSPKTK